jgi:hypothetical protein
MPLRGWRRTAALIFTNRRLQVFRRLSFQVFRRSGLFTCPLLLLLLVAVPAMAQKKKTSQPPPPRLGEVTIDRYRELIWQPEDNYFLSPGPVRIILRDADTGQETVLTADDAEAIPVKDAQGRPTGELDIKVKGHLRLERPEGVLSGRALSYRARSQTGEVSDAEGRVENLLLHGRRIELLPGQVLRATDASFTTCDRARPDYHITAREIRINAGGKVKAKNVTFWLGSSRILSLPYLEKTFRHTVENPIPLPGFSKENGLQMRFSNDIVSEPSLSFNYNITLSLRRTPQGLIAYERDLGATPEDAAPPQTHVQTITDPLRSALESHPALLRESTDPIEGNRRTTFYALLDNGGFVYNRNRTDLRVSRLPEIGLSLSNILSRQALPDDPNAPRPPAESAFGKGFFSPGKWLLNADAGMGYVQERPTGAEDAKLGFRAEAISPLFRVAGPLYVRYGGTAWTSAYSSGNAYALLGPEAELSYLPNRRTLIGAAYRYFQDFGKTPFLFDRRDVRHELRLRYGFLGTHWAYDLGVNYDMERKRAYDTLVSFRRRFDCMEVGISYHTRSQGFSIILNLLPGNLQKLTAK